MKFTRYITAVALSVALCACGARREADETAHHHSHDHHHEGHHHDNEGSHDDEDEDAIVIEPAKALKLGITTQKVAPVKFAESIKVSGEVSAPAGSRRALVATGSGVLTLNPGIEVGTTLSTGQIIGYVNGSDILGGDMAKALQADYDAANRELERLRPLYEHGVVSAKEFNAAQLAFDKASIALGNMSGSKSSVAIKAPQTGTLFALDAGNGDYVEAGQSIGAIGDNSALTLRADLPKRYHAKASGVNDAFVVPSCGDCEGFLLSSNNGRRRTGNANVGGNMSGFLPIYFTFNNNGAIESAGYVDVYLRIGDEQELLALPDRALFEQQGQWFVFVKLDEDCYEKRPVVKGGSDGSMTRILSGVSIGEEVVVEGVTFVKLAESAGVVPEGHSHSH